MGERPKGRAEIRRAVLDSAASLFASRGPASVSMRTVADAAGVNYGLIHRHFGTKEVVLGQVVDELGTRLATDLAPVGTIGTAMDVVERHAEFVRILAFLCLENSEAEALRREHPTIGGIMRRLDAEASPGSEIPVRVAAAIALAMGWIVYEPFLRDAVGLDRFEPDDVRRGLHAAAERASALELEP